MRDCAAVHEALSAFADGQLAALPAEVQVHLNTCADCREAERAYRQVSADLATFYRKPFQPVSVAALIQRQSQLRRRWLAAAVGVAAMLLIGISVWQATMIPAETTERHFPIGALQIPADRPARFEIEGAIVWADAGVHIAVDAPRKVRITRGAAHFAVLPGGGEFSIALPHGVVAVLGTEFVITVDQTSSEVVVQHGSVRLENPSGNVTLGKDQAAVSQSGRAPQPQEGVAAAGRMLWRPWDSLRADERTERMSVLKLLLDSAQHAERVLGRKVLAAGDAPAIDSALVWYADGSPRIKVETVLLCGQLPRGNVAAHTFLRQIASSETEKSELRLPAIRILGDIGTAQDLEFLRSISADTAAGEELQQMAAEAAQKIRLQEK
jgi:hypothetical protein